MARYGTDKPDLRFELELVECTDYFKNTPFRVFQAPYVGAVVMPGGGSQARRQLDAWQEWAKQRGARGLAYVLIGEDGELGGPVAKTLSDDERAGLAAHVGAKPGDCVFFAAGPPTSSRALLGAARLEIGRRCGLIDEDAWKFVWIVDAPLFEPVSETEDVAVGSGAWTAVHHAFTSPKPESMDTFDTDPADALAYAYDVVCNGNEIGGGSIRIHRRDVQERVFKVMGLAPEEAQEKFGFLLDAFSYGAPPHGGIAFGWDRITALLARAESIRDIMSIEAELSNRQAQLDSLTQQQAYLADQTSLATIKVSIERKPSATPAPKKDDDHGFLAGLTAGWDGLRATVVAVLTVVGAVLPFAVVGLLVGVPVWLLIRRLRREPAAVAAPVSGGE
jgi:aspartyl-tRNA synthetase